MNTTGDINKHFDKKILLSTLWIIVIINILTADILSLYIPGTLDQLVKVAGTTPIQQLMLAGAIMIEISVVMILLSRVLRREINRWTNIAASLITIVFVVGGGSAYPHYIFLETVEVMCLVVIIWQAWTWPISAG